MAPDTHITDKALILLTPGFPANESQDQTGWVPHAQSLIRSINRNFPGLEVIILTFQFPASTFEYYWCGNRVIPFGGAHRSGKRNLLIWYKAFKVLIGLRKQKHVLGMISLWCAECCLVGSYFSRLYSINHLCWISGQDAQKNNKFVKRIRPRENELVAMSEFLMEEFYKNHGIRPKYMIPDAIDTSEFPDEQPERTIDILGAGNLIPLKQYHIFVEVIKAIAPGLNPLKVVLCGSGPEEQPLKAQISQAGLENRISMPGMVPHKELLSMMKKAKVFLHTSMYEGFGNVCIEALYAGAHVVSFTRPMKQDIPHWHIVITQEEMIAKTQSLLHDPQTQYTQVIPFNMDDTASEFINLLSSKP